MSTAIPNAIAHASHPSTPTTPAASPPATAAPPSSSPGETVRSFLCDDYLQLQREAETWLIRPLIPVGGTVNIYGDAKTGKSYAAIQLAAAITGTFPDWLGFQIASAGPVLYVQLDTPRNLWMDRIEEIKAAGYDLSRISFADRESLDAWPFNILNPEHFRRLRTEVDRTRASAVIIDVLKEAHHADENSSTEMQPVIAQLQNVCRPACLILLSHSRKAQMESGPDLVNDQRGSNYVPTRMDSIIRFTKKHMIYIGRACEEGSIKAKRLDCGLWAPEQAEVDAHIAAVLNDVNLKTKSDQARALAGRTGKTEESARALLRRTKIETPRTGDALRIETVGSSVTGVAQQAKMTSA